jgi:hypothetical protein
MANSLSPELLAEIFAQESSDPFLTLVTLSHTTFAEDILLVNNSKDIVSRGNTYLAFPMKIRLPVDDGETQRDFSLEMDNASLEFIEEIRTVTSRISVKFEMILASLPDDVQMAQEDLAIVAVTYNSKKISARIAMDSFLGVEITCEKYSPTSYPGIF